MPVFGTPGFIMGRHVCFIFLFLLRSSVELSAQRIELKYSLKIALPTYVTDDSGAARRGAVAVGAGPQTPGRLRLNNVAAGSAPDPRWGSAPDSAGGSRPQTLS